MYCLGFGLATGFKGDVVQLCAYVSFGNSELYYGNNPLAFFYAEKDTCPDFIVIGLHVMSIDEKLFPIGDNSLPLSNNEPFSSSSEDTFKLSIVLIEVLNNEII